MEFRLGEREESLRREVRAFFDRELPPDWSGVYPDAEFEGEYWDFVRGFSAKLLARGWPVMGWPEEHGGRGAPVMEQVVYKEELAYRRAPDRDLVVGVNLVAPTLMVHGTEEQQRAFLPSIASGEDVYCQGFSEPESGSDLASLQCAAVRDGDDYVLNGSKIWTSGAHRSNRVLLLARTDPNAPKHRGITVFLVPMDLPGITVRPIVNMMEVHYFNQVFFDDVRISREMMVGEENRGWYVAATTLDFERSGIGLFANNQRSIDDLTAFVRERSANGGPRLPAPLRHALAETAVANHAGVMLAYRIASMQAEGLIPNQEASASKLLSSELSQRIAQVGMRILGLYGQPLRGSRRAVLGGMPTGEYLYTISNSIQGGTSEVQRHIIATRGLGLPRAMPAAAVADDAAGA